MKKISAVILTTIMVLSLVACGGGGRADDAYVGKWLSVSGTAFGYTMTGDDISGFDIELKSGGKGTMTIEGDKTKIKWTNDDISVNINIQGEELVGTIGQDTLTFIDILGTGMDLTFAKEGTEAAEPINALPENEKAMIGSWGSYAVADVMGDDVSSEVPADSLQLIFKADHTVDITFRGEALNGEKWAMLDDFGYLEDDDAEFTWETADGEIQVTYSGEDNYWVFSCAKN